MYSRDSHNWTLDNVDLTTSPVKHRNEQRDTEKINEDTNDDTYKTVGFNKDRATKVYEINIEKKKILKERREKALQNAKYRNAEK